MEIRKPPLGKEQVDAVLTVVSSHTGVSIEKIRHSDLRHPHIVEARHMAFLALKLAGLTIAEIGRALEKDHSTVTRALELIHLSDSCQKVAEAAARQALPATALDARVQLVMKHESYYRREAVRAYLRTAVLGTGMAQPSLVLCGLWCIASRPDLKRHIYEALRWCAMEHHMARIEQHAKRCGLPWVYGAA